MVIDAKFSKLIDYVLYVISNFLFKKIDKKTYKRVLNTINLLKFKNLITCFDELE